jgi:hypothetical protein
MDTLKSIVLSKKNNKLFEKKDKTPTKRVITQKWTFAKECYEYLFQINLINDIFLHASNNTKVFKTVIQEINKKIYGYKQQDLLKNKYNETNFLTFENIIAKMIETKLKCYYCNCETFVLYDISREKKQWSVDRIDNTLGHNTDNYYISCLECNLKRRCIKDDKYLFTKQLNIIKHY